MSEGLAIQLKSEDGVIFKVQDYHLKSSSKVFRDMLAIPTGTATGATPATSLPIDIPAHSVIVGTFVSLIEHTELPLLDDWQLSFPPLHQLYGEGKGVESFTVMLDLLDQFDCAKDLAQRMMAYFEQDFKEDVWTVMCLAATRNDIITFKKALRAISATSWADSARLEPGNIIVSDAGRMPLGWYKGYWVAWHDIDSGKAVQRADCRSHKQLNHAVHFWDCVAKGFKVAQ